MADDGDEVAMSARLDAQHAEAVLGVMERHALDGACKHLVVGLAGRQRCGHDLNYRLRAQSITSGTPNQCGRRRAFLTSRRLRRNPGDPRTRSFLGAACADRPAIFERAAFMARSVSQGFGKAVHCLVELAWPPGGAAYHDADRGFARFKGLSRNKCSNFAKTAQYFQCVIRYS